MPRRERHRARAGRAPVAADAVRRGLCRLFGPSLGPELGEVLRARLGTSGARRPKLIPAARAPTALREWKTPRPSRTARGIERNHVMGKINGIVASALLLAAFA